MEQLMRDFFLFLAKNKTLTRLAKKYGLRFGAGRFVAGATLESSIAAIKKLNEKGMPVTIDHLGEFVDNEKEAAEMTDHCIQAIKAIAKEKLDSQLSLKMTSMGLDISDELVLRNMRKIMDEATKHNVMITIDMEDYSRCGKTLDIFKQLKKEYDNISTVIQAYLYRSLEDVQALNEYQPFLRLVKGAYKEPAKVAYPEKSDVDKNFERLIETHLLNGNYTAVATHDDEIIRFTKELVDKHSIPYDQFEFQMLYGIRVERQEQLLQEGYKMRIYVPYGNDWYGYFMRRLAERPANVMFVLKGVFGK
ncbi:proline dehydrogenase [Fictibacillus barbaricus]|uniref:proline dehydrogenase n=1 Tax=Fictibacillus barbaricus TaxID=182136 RepID=A0ABU1U0H5_9BACL|nr:proline dehydrogenase [Fictibacillus barbaricus]MDR7072950.1 proline dehydrogenase [Fictibacillus barbaricus]